MNVSTDLPFNFHIGNSIVSSEGSANPSEICAPCAGSEMTLKEKMAELDSMELVQGNGSDSEEMIH